MIAEDILERIAEVARQRDIEISNRHRATTELPWSVSLIGHPALGTGTTLQEALEHALEQYDHEEWFT